MDVILKNYYKEADPRLEELKRFVIKQIAQNPIEFVDLHQLAYRVDKYTINGE